MGRTEYRLLGSVQALRDGVVLPIDRRHPRAVLALLLIDRGKVVPVDALIAALWADKQPGKPQTALHGYVSTLRRALGAESIETRPGGYVLNADPDDVDAERFQELVQRAGDGEQSGPLLREALALWHGPALADFAYEPWAQDAARRLDELRLAALERLNEIRLARGEGPELVAELGALVQSEPLHERLCGQYMVALFRAGRQADALDVYHALRTRLAEEVGIDPARELQSLYRQILNQDEELDRQVRPGERDVAVGESVPPPPRRRNRRLRTGAIAGVLVAAATAAAAGVILSSGGAPRVVHNAVAEVSPLTNRVVRRTHVGDSPTSVAAGNGMVWALNAGDGTLSEIAESSGKLVRTTGAAGVPAAITFADGSAWVLDQPRSVLKIEPTTGDIRARIRWPGPAGQGFLPVAYLGAHGNIVWATARQTLARIDTHTLKATAVSIPDWGPVAVGSNSVWVAATQELVRFDAMGRRVVATIPYTSPDAPIAFAAGWLWAVDTPLDAIAQFDPRSNSLVRTIDVGGAPSSVAAGFGDLWATVGGTLLRIDPRRGTIIARIAVGGALQDVTFDDGRVWVAVG